MARFGGSEFIGFSVPLVFSGRYFLLEPGEKPLLSVFVEQNGKPIFEVLKNKPARNQITDVTTNATGVVTITDKKTASSSTKFGQDPKRASFLASLIEARFLPAFQTA